MPKLVVLTAAEQVAAHLRDGLLQGTWSGLMPGGDRLAAELGIGRDTVEAALRRLEKEGLLVNQGRRRGRLIMSPTNQKPSGLRVMLLLYENADRALAYVTDLQHRLQESGHSADFANETLMDLGRDVRRVAAFVGRQKADAWIVLAGSREVVEWFAAGPVPAFALFGRRRGIPIAGVGPDKIPVIRGIVRRLVELGHRRIVLFVRSEQRKPQPGALERAFLEEMAAQGISTGGYHLPDWEETAEGFMVCLKELFRITPPSALIIDEAPFLFAALQFLGRQGLRVPEDVSLICADPDPAFAWCLPTISHIRWDSRPVVKRILRWTENVSRGTKDLRQTLTKAEFVEGGTIGPHGG